MNLVDAASSALPPLPVGAARLAVVYLVDPRGWVLLQERDSEAPRAPDQWGMVGGHVEDGEEPEVAAYRELAEETGISLPDGALSLWTVADFTYPDGHAGRYWILVGQTELTDADIVVGEGRRIVFVDPATTGDLDLAPSTAHFLPQFLASAQYRSLGGA